MAIPAFNAYGMLTDIGNTIQSQNDAANLQAQQLYQQAQANQLLGTTDQAPQPQSFVQRLISGLSGAQPSPPTPAPANVLAPAQATLRAAPAQLTPAAPSAPVGNSPAPVPAKDAYGLYRNVGLPDSGARAVLAGLQGESGANLNPTATNNSGTDAGGVINPNGAFGVAQWNGPRQAQLLNFARQTGGDPRDAATQHKFVAWDMQHNFPDVWATMNDPNVSDQDKLAVFVTRYENPKDKQAAINQRSQYLKADYGGQTSAPANQVASASTMNDASPISPGGATAAAAAPVLTAPITTIDKMRAMDPSQLAVVIAGNPTLAPVAKALLEQKIKAMASTHFRPVTDPAERAAAGYGADDKRPIQLDTTTGKYEVGTEPASAKEAAKAEQLKEHVLSPGAVIVKDGKEIYRNTGSADTMPDQSADFLAERVLAGDAKALAGLGRGSQGANNIAKVQSLVAQKAAERGIDAKDMLEATAEQAGLNAQQRTFGTQTARMASASTEAQGAIALGRDASAAVPRGNWVPVTKAIQALQSGTSDPMLAKFGAANQAIINTYARAINPTGTPTVNDKQHAETMLSTATGPEAYNAVLDQMQAEIDLAHKSPQVAQAMLRNIRKGKPAMDGISAQPLTPESGPFTAAQPGEAAGGGVRGGMAPPPKLGSVPVPPPAAQMLKQNPALRPQFDAKYGMGAADMVLGPAH